MLPIVSKTRQERYKADAIRRKETLFYKLPNPNDDGYPRNLGWLQDDEIGTERISVLYDVLSDAMYLPLYGPVIDTVRDFNLAQARPTKSNLPMHRYRSRSGLRYSSRWISMTQSRTHFAPDG